MENKFIDKNLWRMLCEMSAIEIECCSVMHAWHSKDVSSFIVGWRIAAIVSPRAITEKTHAEASISTRFV